LTVNGTSDADTVLIINSTGAIRLIRDVQAYGNLEVGGDLIVDGSTVSVGNLTVPNITLSGLLTAPNINVGSLVATGGLNAPSITSVTLSRRAASLHRAASTFGGNPLSTVINSQARGVIRSVFGV
jgi:hypothetical protein